MPFSGSGEKKATAPQHSEEALNKMSVEPIEIVVVKMEPEDEEHDNENHCVVGEGQPKDGPNCQDGVVESVDIGVQQSTNNQGGWDTWEAKRYSEPPRLKLCCHACGWAATSRQSLIAHVGQHGLHTGVYPPAGGAVGRGECYRCDDCSYRTLTKSGMRRHLEVHSEGKNAGFYKCDECTYRTMFEPFLARHRRVHSGAHGCPYCDYRAVGPEDLREHAETHYDERPHVCRLCDKRFARIWLLNRHAKIHAGKVKLECDLCPYTGYSESRYREHRATHVADADAAAAYRCDVCSYQTEHSRFMAMHKRAHCGYRADGADDLTEHAKSHLDKRPYSCDKRFSRTTALGRHIRTHTGEKPFSCDVCDYRGCTKTDLGKHKASHGDQKPHRAKNKKSVKMDARRCHTGRGEELACDSCDFRTELSRHRLASHPGEKRYACTLCSGGSYTRRTLKAHQAGRPPPYNCHYCHFGTDRRRHLKTHIKVHAGRTAVLCEYCLFETYDRLDLVDHTRRRHCKEVFYKCERCDYRAPMQKDLVGHMSVHSGEKPFPCCLCHYRTTSLGELRRHMRVHSGEKPFACDSCQFKTYQKGNLVRHSRTHTGEKPFACEFCDYRTIDQGALKKHRRKHTGERPYACDKCDYRASVLAHLHIHKNTHEKYEKLNKKNKISPT